MIYNVNIDEEDVKMRKGFWKGAGAALAGVLVLAGAYFAGGTQVQAAGRTVAISSCLISGDKVECKVTASALPQSDDGIYYLFSDEVCEDGPTGNIVGKAKIGKSADITFDLDYDTKDSNLSRKFLVAVKRGSGYEQVSNEHYITNPEAAAKVSAVRLDTRGIKGLLPDPTYINDDHLEDLGISQVTYNIDLGDIVGETSDPSQPTTYFDYNGQRYAFNTAMLHAYDGPVLTWTQKGLSVTLNILNSEKALSTDLVYPDAKDGHECPNYAFNTADSAGVEHLEAVAAFLGQRYNGKNGWGQVDNWIVGNEVNARTEQYYMQSTDLDTNVNAYNKAFRIFYNGIKAQNGSARIYNSIDQEWGRKSNPGSFFSKEYLDRFNYYMKREGDIDWGLSFHPYDSPLYDPYAWYGLTQWVHKDLKTPYITMQNLYLLIDYMHQKEFLSPSGDVRSISISEIGFTSSFGDDLQCASIVYGYLQAAHYPDIDAFMLYRETDNRHEMESNIAQGLLDPDGNKKPAYDYYKAMGTADEATYKAKASAIIGQDVDSLIGITNFKTRSE